MTKKRYFGSIRRIDGGRWQVRYLDPLTGRRLPAPSTFATKGDASRWLASLEGGALDVAGLSARHADERLGPFARQWIATRQLKPRTRETYEGQFRLHIAPTFEEARVAKLQPRDIRIWHAELLAGPLNDVTVAKVYRLLRSILNTAVDEGLVRDNPCQIKGAGVERSAERPIPTLDEVRRIAEALPDRYALVPWIAALAGLRKGEILGLARRHISIDDNTIRVDRALQEINGEGARFVLPKTQTSQRTVSVPDRLLVLIEAHLQAHVELGPDALLFTNSAGRPVRATVWSKAWNEARQTTGLDGLRLHDLRHLAGTLTAQAGATLKETMERLGHSSPAAALRYQHVASERAAQVARRIDDLLG